VDDRAIVTTQNPDSQRTAHLSKVEIVDEMIAAAQLQWERDYPGDPDLNDQPEKQTATIRDLQQTMSDRQSLLDDLRLDRRSKMEFLRAQSNEAVLPDHHRASDPVAVPGVWIGQPLEYQATHHPWPGAIANAADFAWAMGVTFPMIVR
jgi:hypothetical protein